MTLRFRKAETADYKSWNEFVSEAPNGNFRQTIFWGEIKSLTGWKPHYYLVEKDEVVCAAALVQEKEYHF